MAKYKISKDKLNNVINEAVKDVLKESLGEVDKRALAQYCLSGNEFLFAVKSPFSAGLKLRAANVSDIQESIAGEVLLSKGLEFSHEIDSMLEGKTAENFDVVKVYYDNEVYYIVWEH